MIDHLSYRGWVGSVEFSEPDGVLHGRLLGTKDLISYEGGSVAALVEDFHESVNEYIELCLRYGKFVPEQENTPQVPIKLEIYRQAEKAAAKTGRSFAEFVEDSILRNLDQLQAS